MTRTWSSASGTRPGEASVEDVFGAVLGALRAHHVAVGAHALAYAETGGGLHLPAPQPFAWAMPPVVASDVPVQQTYSAVAAGDDEAAQQLRAANMNTEQAVQAAQATARDGTGQAADQFRKDKNLDSFKQRMEELRRKTKKAADDAIDKSFDAAENIGARFPKSQDTILAVTTKVVNFIDGVVTSIVNFVTNLINNIVDWVEHAWDKIKGFFESVGDTIGHFFAGL